MVVDYFIKKEYNIENPEFSEMSGIMEKDQQKRICWNRKEALNNQSPKHCIQRIFTISASGCVVMLVKRSRNNFIKVNVIFEQSKELRFVRFINIFTIFKNICQRELFLWYHRHISFRGVVNWFLATPLYHKPRGDF